jgi:hypothetical protein
MRSASGDGRIRPRLKGLGVSTDRGDVAKIATSPAAMSYGATVCVIVPELLAD